MFEGSADLAVEVEEVVGQDTFAIRRVGDHKSLLWHRFELGDRALFDFDVFRETGRLNVLISNLYSAFVDVVAIDFVSEFALATIVVVDIVEEVGIEVAPFFESERLAIYTRWNVEGDEGSLDEECARTTHRVDEISFAIPTSHEEHTSSKSLRDRGLVLRIAVTTFVETFARRVECDSTFVVRDVYVYI